jgi:simple sugar transport system ATP-binding protein
MRALGLAHVPEDRLRQGMVAAFQASRRRSWATRPSRRTAATTCSTRRPVGRHCATLMDRFDVRPRAPALRSSNFSGGNQQKLVLAREMDSEPRVLLVGQPTRGVDIGAIDSSIASW